MTRRLFGQRRRYAIVGVLAHRGPMTAAGIALLVRSWPAMVRADLAILERAEVIEADELADRKPYYRLAGRDGGT